MAKQNTTTPPVEEAGPTTPAPVSAQEAPATTPASTQGDKKEAGTPTPKTQAQVDDLKRQYKEKRDFDLVETPGFEAHKEELRAFVVQLHLKGARMVRGHEPATQKSIRTDMATKLLAGILASSGGNLDASIREHFATQAVLMTDLLINKLNE